MDQHCTSNRCYGAVENLISDGPNYNPDAYNSDSNVQNTHNCYDYAINNYNIQRQKTHPGESIYGSWEGKDVESCQQMIRRVSIDRKLIPISYNKECPPNTYKIGMMIDPDKDYHFIRQDNSGLWSQKPGNDEARDTDFSGMLLSDPENADFDDIAVGLNYTTKCGYFCIDRSF